MIIQGDCLEVMRSMDDNSISAIVTDPPYGLHFMGKDWDQYAKGKSVIGKYLSGAESNSEAHNAARYDERRNDEFQEFIYQVSLEALRIVKPGGHILMFGAPRRFHRQACGLEDAGWEIRDCLSWLYGSGFPKSHNHFGIEGYGTALKPAWEPVIMAMKPCDGTFKQNAEKWGHAGINIDDCRIETNDNLGGGQQKSSGVKMSHEGFQRPWMRDEEKRKQHATKINENVEKSERLGRWPANLILDEEAAQMLDEQSGISKSSIRPSTPGIKKSQGRYGDYNDYGYKRGVCDSGGSSRFFYCAKASARERNEGLEGMPLKDCGIKNDSGRGFSESDPYKTVQYKNNHPTVKPLKLMEYLIKLVMPPKDGILLDPFAGSGTTILAAKRLGFDAIGIEKDAEYCKIAKARIDNFKEKDIIKENQQFELFAQVG